MAFIGFFDLLGVSLLAEEDTEQYTHTINAFSKAMLYACNLVKMKPDDCLYAYSDNAYIQMHNPEDMCHFFQTLRSSLMYDHIYFSAAISQGTLNANMTVDSFAKNKRPINHYVHLQFLSKEAASIYSQQSKFKGIGINASADFCNALNISNTFCKSYYCPSIDSFELVPFTDLAFESVTLDTIKFALNELIQTKITNKRASRYYISLISTLIQSLDNDELSTREKQKALMALFLFKNSIYIGFESELINEISLFTSLFLIRLYKYCTETRVSFSATFQSLISECSLEYNTLINQINKPIMNHIIPVSIKKEILKCLVSPYLYS